MTYTDYQVTINDAGRRIDRIVRRLRPDHPLSAIYRMLRKGLIKLDGKRVSRDTIALEGSILSIAELDFVFSDNNQLSEPALHQQKTTEVGISTIIETSDLLFLNKPSGIMVHGENGLDGLITQSQAAQDSLSFKSGPLHRLDKETTGLIVFSRSLRGAQWFSEGIKEHQFIKIYIGIVDGIMDKDSQWIDTTDDGKKMKTFVYTIANTIHKHSPPCSLVLFRIFTGRKHQIRIQGCLHEHPLSGDKKYTSHRFPEGFYLHAWQMQFPRDRLAGIPEKVIAPLPEMFRKKVATFFGEKVLALIDSDTLYWNKNEEHQ